MNKSEGTRPYKIIGFISAIFLVMAFIGATMVSATSYQVTSAANSQYAGYVYIHGNDTVPNTNVTIWIYPTNHPLQTIIKQKGIVVNDSYVWTWILPMEMPSTNVTIRVYTTYQSHLYEATPIDITVSN